ncbi:MAG TPA: malto-oligosyltrehalose trehalohydrolase [Jatrophihabitans sp.]
MTELAVWAPNARRVQAQVGASDDTAVHELTAGAEGWWSADIGTLVAGTDYGFLVDDDPALLPDPRSRRQPSGVHGPSRWYVDDFAWTDSSWRGRDLAQAVVYELHVGTFTAGGTFAAIAERLDHLVDLGVTHVELLPVNAFNGQWNWGYDGVLWYAVHEPYGGPDELKRLVDECHRRGLAVLLDAVYNHFGPSGNYVSRFGPYLRTGRSTWGDLVNLDGASSAEVRRFIIDNALMWLDEFHIDGLRLDAVHALVDSSTPHLLAELSAEVDALASRIGLPRTLIAESDLNDPVMITPRSQGGYGLAAQWDDDVHHALHVLLSGERQGYYDDFAGLDVLAKVFTSAFFHDGTYSTFRGRVHGKPVDRTSVEGWRFVVCLQNHDQVGNRAAGDRLPEITSPGLLRVGAVLLLTSPFTPMLWMGEEWAASTRWPFFTSHPEPELAEATGKGRVEEFSRHGWDVSQMIDPQDPAAFESAKLNWDEVGESEHRSMLELYSELLRLRRELPDLRDPQLDRVRVDFDEQARWLVVHRGALRVAVNLADVAQVVPVPATEILFGTDVGAEIRAGELRLPAQSAAIVEVLER